MADGLSKPYLDAQGRLWVKQGADKRHVTSREEMQRMFQRSGLVRADRVPVAGSTTADLEDKAFAAYFERRYGQSIESTGATHGAMARSDIHAALGLKTRNTCARPT